MTTHNLLSVGQLCDAGCTATVTRDNIEVSHNDQVIITGTRSAETTLWHMDLPSEVDPQSQFPYHANAAIGNNTAANMVAFMHAAFFSPAISTLEKALQKGYINNIPGFTQATLKKYPPQSAAMIKGHLDQTRQNIRSTKNIITHQSRMTNFIRYNSHYQTMIKQTIATQPYSVKAVKCIRIKQEIFFKHQAKETY